uniref:Aminotransferase-like plant mobile domain-containing protein n=1 Tax=Fagus sylvatica TaxID=28930 RepID=A0A2N9FZD7_FAGSY
MASIEVAPRIRHQCSVTKLMEVNKSLAEECKSQLQTTPFGWLLNLHCNIEASGRILEVMATRWNADARAFQVGDRLIPFTLYDIALILGLPVRGEPIDWNQSSFWGLHRCKRKKVEATCTFKVALPCFRYGHASTWGLVTKNAEINQPFPRFLAWTHQRMYTKKASEAFSNSANVLSVLVAMPWEQEFNVVEEAMETLQETHGSSHPIISRDDGAGPSSIPQTPSNELQLELQAERAEREALARQVRRLKDELDHVKAPTLTKRAPTLTKPAPTLTLTKPAPTLTKPAPTLTLTKPAPTLTLTQPAPTLTKPAAHSNPHCGLAKFTVQGCQERQSCQKKKAKVAVVDLASSPSKQDNAGEAAAAMVDLVSSPSKGATSVTYTRAKTRAHKNLMIVAPHSEPVINEWVDAHFLYQPTAADEAVLADFRKKWGGSKRRGTRKRPNEVDSNEMAISTDTYELTGREVSSLLADQAQDDGSRWISTAVVDAFKDVLMRKLTQTGHPPPYINFVISVHGGTTILGMAPSTSTQRGKRTRKGKQPIQDDQPQPQAMFRPSWVRSMPTNCNRIFAPACHNGHFVMMVVDCLQKVFYFFDSLPTATHRALAPTLRKVLEQICMENLKAYGCPYMAPKIQG